MSSQGRPTKKQCMYVYTPISEVKGGETVDLFGVVKYFTAPAKTRGKDIHRCIKLVDPSVKDIHGGGLLINCFGVDESSLPQIESAGDILRLHRIKISVFKKALQGNGRRNCQSSYLCFSGEPGISVEPRASSTNFTLTNEDKRKVEDLRNWAALSAELQREISAYKLDPVFTSLAYCPSPKRYFNFICQVIAVIQLSPELLIARVWDGTRPCRRVLPQFPDDRAPLVSIPDELMVDLLIYDEHVNVGKQLRPFDLVQINNIHVKQAGPQPTSTLGMADVSVSIPGPSGTTLYGARKQVSGSPRAADEQSAVELFLHGGDAYGRGLRRLDNSLLEQRLRDRLSRSGIVFEPGPSTVCDQQPLVRAAQPTVTAAGNIHMAFSTIEQIKRSKIPSRFRVRGRIVSHWPANVADFVQLRCTTCHCLFSCPIKEALENVEGWLKHGAEFTRKDLPVCDIDSSASIRCASVSSGGESLCLPCPSGMISCAGLWWDATQQPLCPHCTTGSDVVQLSFVYAFALVLRDSTGEMDLRVYGEDGYTFFGQVPATNLNVDNCSCQHIQACVKALLGSDEKPSQFECCVKSYHMVKVCKDANLMTEPGDEYVPTDHAMYRVFDTIVNASPS